MTAQRLFPLFVCYFIGPAITSFATLSIIPSVEPVLDYPAGLPIPTAPDAPTSKQFVAIANAWGNRAIVTEYRREHPGDKITPGFLEEAVRYISQPTEQVRKQLITEADRLERTAGDDPAFQLMAALVHRHPGRKQKLLRSATVSLPKTNYSRFLLYTAAALMAESLHDTKAAPAEVADADRLALEALKDGLNQDSFHLDEMSALRLRLSGDSTSSLLHRHAAEVITIFQQAVALPDWIREFGQGRAYLRAAWEDRTDGWSYEVPESGWAGWEQNLAHAREHLTRAWQLNPSDPAAAACMIEVAMGDGGAKQEMRLWFDRAVAAQIDYFDAYKKLTWALRPRWHGSHEAMLQFGDECLATGRFDTCVPYAYFKIVSDISSEQSDHKAIYERAEIARNLRTALDTYLQTPDMPLVPAYAHTMAAVLDYRSGNLAAARTHMAAIQFQPADIGKGLGEEIPAMMKLIATP